MKMMVRWKFILIAIFSGAKSIGADVVSISQTILEDMIPQQFEGGGQSQCSDPGTTKFRYKNEIDFGESYNRWNGVNSPYEEDTFLVEMSDLSSNSEGQKWTARFGQGGNIYSLFGAYGEAIPPQGNDFSPFVDEVIQMVAHDTSQFNGTDTDYYIHQAGAYLYRKLKLPERPVGVPPAFFSPSLGMYCSQNTCRFMTWGQQSHLPTTHRSDVMYFHEYRNCGSGVMEYTQVMQYVGDPSDTSGTQTKFYLNTPWTGIRTSNLPDLMFSSPSGVLQGKVYPMPQFGTANVIDSSTTGGFTTLSQRGKDVVPALTSLAVPCVETSGTWNYACSGSSLPLKFQANSDCVAQTKPDKRHYIKCAWSRNPHVGFTALQSPIVGCQTCGKEMQIKNVVSGEIINVRYILDWNRNGYVSFESSDCTAVSCPIGHSGMVQRVNNLFKNDNEVIFSLKEDTSNDVTFEIAPSLTFVHGQGWSRTPTQNLQYGQGGAAHRRDMTVFTFDSVVHLFPGESFVSRQYLISDTGANVESRAQTLKNAAYSTIVTNAFRNDSTKPYFGGRKIDIYASDTGSFDVAVASVLGGQKTSCGSASATVKCEGVTVPKDSNGNVYQLRPFFFISCGGETYFGPNQYHFTPPRDGSNSYYQANLCANTADTTTRPAWEFLGFFSPSDPGCLALQNYVYDKTLCDEVESSSPTSVPSSMPSGNPTVMPSSVSSHLPSLNPTTEPSSIPSIALTGSPSRVPTIYISSNPSMPPSMSPSVSPSANPSSNPSIVQSSFPTNLGSSSPSKSQSSNPSLKPSILPSLTPSLSESIGPSKEFSINPSEVPTVAMSSAPSISGSTHPTFQASISPSILLSSSPTLNPSTKLSSIPTHFPTSSLSMAPSQKNITNCKSWCSKIPIPWDDIPGNTQKCDFIEFCDGCSECEIEDSEFYWTVCGKPGSCSTQQQKAQIEEYHEVRCCSDTAKAGWTKKEFCDVWGGSLLPMCKYAETYAFAKQICEDNNARLCTKVELELGCTSGSGCDHDSDNVWSSTPWEVEQSHMIVCAKGQNCQEGDFQAAGDNERHEVTCCSDEQKTGWNKKTWCSVWTEAEISGKCYYSETYDTAEHICSKNGARLCTKQEILGKCAKNSGCQHNNDLIWSQTMA